MTVDVRVDIKRGSLWGSSTPRVSALPAPLEEGAWGPLKDVLAVSIAGSRLFRPHQHINNVANLGRRGVLGVVGVFLLHPKSASDDITLASWEQMAFKDKVFFVYEMHVEVQ